MKKFTFQALVMCLILGVALVSSEMDDQFQVAMKFADTKAQGEVKPIDQTANAKHTETIGNFSWKGPEMTHVVTAPVNCPTGQILDHQFNCRKPVG
ncbi:AGAP008923-PB-like protein [Anopheles sinensis]|uniref:AGAP008923-PB-like protein n=1 Tax=Anopheles sinensis TaxID=74873 RepID=A0A084W7G3_ANOSI|nr:AGAP008923-PB-like protein [Anopheles sinensis]